MEDLLKQKDLEIERLKQCPIGPGNDIGQPPNTSKNATGTSSTSDPVAAALWAKVETYLARRGIEGRDVTLLKGALENKNMGIRDTDNRLRIMIWDSGNGLLPVAMIWRSKGRPRVLFPGGTEQNVENKDLEEISQSAEPAP